MHEIQGSNELKEKAETNKKKTNTMKTRTMFASFTYTT